MLFLSTAVKHVTNIDSADGNAFFEQKRITVGMSGGVDSSVTALLLRREGHLVSGLFMKNWTDEQDSGHCTAARDLKDAMEVCAKIGIDIDGEDFSEQYRKLVFQHFLVALEKGLTPNPDILCNREIKFRVFLEHALHAGADAIATGHYARIRYDQDRFHLLKAIDSSKDQSYFLYTLGQRELAKSIFPLGEMNKTKVRSIAREAGMLNHDKKDSTGICFIGERHFTSFLKNYFAVRHGPIETPEGKNVGIHQGLMFYTLGQRRGLGIGGRNDGNQEPWYVAAKNVATNTLIVVQGARHSLLYSSALIADEEHWIQPPVEHAFRCHAKIRYRQKDQGCTVERLDGGKFKVFFDHPQWAATPGQSVVLYQGDECLGGGIIRATSQ